MAQSYGLKRSNSKPMVFPINVASKATSNYLLNHSSRKSSSSSGYHINKSHSTDRILPAMSAFKYHNNGISSNGTNRNIHQHHQSKPSLEIYRPPSARFTSQTTANSQLNVYAKEFIARTPLQPSKSSGNILHTIQKSSSNHNKRITPASPILSRRPRKCDTLEAVQKQHHRQLLPIQRSKSMTSASSATGVVQQLNHSIVEGALKSFPVEDQRTLRPILQAPDESSSRCLMDSVRLIMARAVDCGTRECCQAAAGLCVTILARAEGATFREALLNTIQEWFQGRDRLLRSLMCTGRVQGTRFTAFMWFLKELCRQLKGSNVRQYLLSDVQRPVTELLLLLLAILFQCCLVCTLRPIRCPLEIECLFFVLASIGHDLEREFPQQMGGLFDNIRDAFLDNNNSDDNDQLRNCNNSNQVVEDSVLANIRRTLLHLIELHASNWQLSGSSVLYYYPTNNNVNDN